jgi:transposase
VNSSRQEFIRFLNLIDAKVPKKKTVHVIVDNYATHRHPNVMDWLAKHPRFVFRFTPTSASWLNAVEGFFAKLTNQRLKRGVFRSLQQLKDAIHAFLEHTNTKPLYLDQGPQPNHRRRQTGAPSVRFDPLAMMPQSVRPRCFQLRRWDCALSKMASGTYLSVRAAWICLE